MSTDGWHLKDGDHVAIIGGGPAGSLFAHFALRAARAVGVRPRITIYEGTAFSVADGAGRNQSAGVVAQDFATELRSAGIAVPEGLVQRHIKAYRLVTRRGEVRLGPPGAGEEVLTVYRGRGPRLSEREANLGLDDYLLQNAQAQGARVVAQYVSRLETPRTTGEPMHVEWTDGTRLERDEAHLVVVAVGANSKFVQSLGSMGLGYVPPRTLGSIQVEVHLGHRQVDAAFGDAISVYALDIPGVRFAAVTPKFDYVTVTLIGEQVGHEQLTALLRWPGLGERLGGAVGDERFAYECRPRAVVGAARHPFADRLVCVGDAAVSRLFKNGLESALVTARAAAEVAVRRGVSAQAFERAYGPVCGSIARDNRWGSFLFSMYAYALEGRPRLAHRLVRAAAYEQSTLPVERRYLCRLLWQILSGTQPYGRIARQLANPGLYWHLLRGKAA